MDNNLLLIVGLLMLLLLGLVLYSLAQTREALALMKNKNETTKDVAIIKQIAIEQKQLEDMFRAGALPEMIAAQKAKIKSLLNCIDEDRAVKDIQKKNGVSSDNAIIGTDVPVSNLNIA